MITICAQNNSAITNEIAFNIQQDRKTGGWYIIDRMGVRFARYDSMEEARANLNDLFLSVKGHQHGYYQFLQRGELKGVY